MEIRCSLCHYQNAGQLWLAEFFLTDHNILLRTIVGNLEFLTLTYFTTSRGL